MQRSGTEAIRTLNPALKTKREIINITICQKRSTEWAAISQKVATQQPKPI